MRRLLATGRRLKGELIDPFRLDLIEAPVLLVWGERDRYLGPHLIDGTERWVADLRVERIAEASHWVQADAPERVNALLIAHLRGPAGCDNPVP
jgi:pimeloyl-ACP methyl ester carboxylesterase